MGRKFEKHGSLGLESKSNLTVEEELQLKIKQLEERNRYLEMENNLLKKLKELENQNRR